MAIAAIEIHESAVRPAPDRFHMNRVIQLDRRRIACWNSGNGMEYREFGMTFLETIDLRGVSRLRTAGFQVRVTTRTGLIARGREIDFAAVLGVTGCAVGRGNLGWMMDGAVVTSEAGRVCGSCGKGAALLNVAGGAFFFEDRVGLRQAATGINAVIAGETAPCNPH